MQLISCSSLSVALFTFKKACILQKSIDPVFTLSKRHASYSVTSFTVALIAIIGILPLRSQCQSITNPSFEVTSPKVNTNNAGGFQTIAAGSTALTGWTIGGPAGIDYFASPQSGLQASDGNYCIDMVRGPGQGGILSSTITGLQTGKTYFLLFDLHQGFSTSGTLVRDGAQVTAKVGNTSDTFYNTLRGVWQTETLTFQASAASMSIQLAGPSSGARDIGVFVDNLRITSVPEPGAGSFAIMACFGMIGVCRHNRRRA